MAKQRGIRTISGEEGGTATAGKPKRTRKTVPLRIMVKVAHANGDAWAFADSVDYATEVDAHKGLATIVKPGESYMFMRTYWQGTAKVESKISF